MSENFIEDETNGERILDCAARVAEPVKNLDGYSELASLIAIRYAESGLLDAAVDLADTVTDPYSREQVLAIIAAECVEFEEHDYADELLQMITDPGQYSMAREQMAVKYAEAGAFDKALETAREIDDSAPALSRIALIYADEGHFAEAFEVARSIEDVTLKTTTLIELAARNLRSDSTTEGVDFLREATNAAEDIEFSQERISSLLEIASLYKESGQEDEAFKTLLRASKISDELSHKPDPYVAKDYTKDDALAAIATSFAKLQRYEQAEPLIEKIEDPFHFSSAATSVALEYHKAGQSAQALALLTEALDVVKEEEVYGERGLTLRENLLYELAVANSVINRYEEALQIAEAITSLTVRHGALKEIAKEGVRSGNYDVVFRIAEVAQEPYAKVLYFIELSDALMEVEQTALAERTLSQAFESAETLERAFEKALALMEIALRHAQRERAGRASELLCQSLSTAALIGDEYQKARALIALDDRYRKTGLELGAKELEILQKIESQIESQD